MTFMTVLSSRRHVEHGIRGRILVNPWASAFHEFALLDSRSVDLLSFARLYALGVGRQAESLDIIHPYFCIGTTAKRLQIFSRTCIALVHVDSNSGTGGIARPQLFRDGKERKALGVVFTTKVSSVATRTECLGG